MFRETVDNQSVQSVLEAIATVHSKLKRADEVWEAFREWSIKNGYKVPLTFEERPIFYNELQDIYAFGFENIPANTRKNFFKICGRKFAEILFREKFPDFLEATLTPKASVSAAIESLFIRFMKEYSGLLYKYSLKKTSDQITIILSYVDLEAVTLHLKMHKRDPAECFERSFLGYVGALEASLENWTQPWAPKNISYEIEGTTGAIRISLPTNLGFNYKKLIQILTNFADELKHRHTKNIYIHDLERDLILQSPLMRQKWEKIKLASATDEIILLRGEPGTGKTFLASRIHQMSNRKEGPFIEVCLTADIGSENFIQSTLFGHTKGAFTSAYEDKSGLFALADKGTIFLDEIGDASADLQAKLLRVIEKKTFKPLGGVKDITVDVRLITSTNKDLETAVREGKFREDLYYRLNMIQIELPPLRERLEDIPILCNHFLRLIAAEVKKPAKPLSNDALQFLAGYGLPGNIRELIHILKYALLFSKGDTITMDDLPDYLSKSTSKLSSQKRPTPAFGAPDSIINYQELCELLAKSDNVAIAKNQSSNYPWHIEYAKKTYLRALIHHCRGNLRKITSYWDRQSERAVRTLIKKYGLTNELLEARARK